jgi:hypothetical protein
MDWNGFHKNFASIVLGLVLITIMIVVNEYRHKVLKMQALPFDDATNKLRIQELNQFKWDILLGIIFGTCRGILIIIIIVTIITSSPTTIIIIVHTNKLL